MVNGRKGVVMSFFKSFGKAVSKGFKAVKSIARSPITKAIAGGVAIAFPAVGIPAVAGLAIANQQLDNVDKAKAMAKKLKLDKLAQATLNAAKGKPPAKQQKAIQHAVMLKKRGAHILQQNAVNRAQMARLLVNTRKAAGAGDKDARRALAAFRIVNSARKGDKGAIEKVKILKRRYDIAQHIKKSTRFTSNARIVRV